MCLKEDVVKRDAVASIMSEQAMALQKYLQAEQSSLKTVQKTNIPFLQHAWQRIVIPTYHY